MMRIVHIVNVSGGKDSTALYLHAMDRLGDGFLPVFADTGHEHPITYDYVRALPGMAGGPAIRWVKADFSDQIAGKRRYIAQHWPRKGVPADRIERALELLHPTGIPFLDLCLWKGRFPSTGQRFCTEELKVIPISEQVAAPLQAKGCQVLQWLGGRREESAERAKLPRWSRMEAGYYLWRPLLDWPVTWVFDQHRNFRVAPNPLYRLGMERVGCMPCIYCKKNELREIAMRFPEQIERVAEWERLVDAVAKRPGVGALFGPDKTAGADKSKPIPPIHDVVRWANTSRGAVNTMAC